MGEGSGGGGPERETNILGEVIDETLDGDVYRATFRGSGWLRANETDGRFLAGISGADLHLAGQSGVSAQNAADAQVADSKRLTMGDFVPQKWQGTTSVYVGDLEPEVEYVFSVELRRLQSVPAVDPNPFVHDHEEGLHDRELDAGSDE